MAKEKIKADSKGKRKRVPFGAHRTKLQVEDTIPGYVLRWFNDVDGRLQRAEEGGYVFVTSDEVPRLGQGALHQGNSDVNSKVSKIVSRGKDEIRAYLMKIKKEYYDEDQAVKESVNYQVDEAMRAGTPSGNVVENQYVPKGHVQRV
jgi:hypothetical protein